MDERTMTVGCTMPSIQDHFRAHIEASGRSVDEQIAVAVAIVMHKLGERILTVTTADVDALDWRKVVVEKTAEGLKFKIV